MQFNLNFLNLNLNLKVKDFFSFKKMITPILIQIIFWIFTAITVIGSIVKMITTKDSWSGEMWLNLLLTLIIAPLLIRVFCEILLVVFSINRNLVDLKEKLLEKQEPAKSPTV
jgi:hypothetical protein